MKQLYNKYIHMCTFQLNRKITFLFLFYLNFTTANEREREREILKIQIIRKLRNGYSIRECNH